MLFKKKDIKIIRFALFAFLLLLLTGCNDPEDPIVPPETTAEETTEDETEAAQIQAEPTICMQSIPINISEDEIIGIVNDLIDVNEDVNKSREYRLDCFYNNGGVYVVDVLCETADGESLSLTGGLKVYSGGEFLYIGDAYNKGLISDDAVNAFVEVFGKYIESPFAVSTKPFDLDGKESLPMSFGEIAQIICAHKYDSGKTLVSDRKLVYSVCCLYKNNGIYAYIRRDSSGYATDEQITETVNGLTFKYPNSTYRLFIYKEGKRATLTKAYERGIIDDVILNELYETWKARE